MPSVIHPPAATFLLSHWRLFIGVFFAVCLGGCGGLGREGSPQSLPSVALQSAPSWGYISTASLPTSDAHIGEVLAVKENSTNPPQVVSVGVDGNITVWNLKEGSGHMALPLGIPAQLATFGLSKALVAWSSGLTIHVACVTGCSERWALTRLKSRSTSLAFHEDDTALLIGGADGRVYRWQFLKERDALSVKEREKILERYIAHQTMVSSVLALHTGRAFFSSDWDGVLYGWLAYTADDQRGDFDKNLFGGRFFGDIGNYIRAARPTDRGITSLALSSDGNHLAVGTDDGFVELWRVRGFELSARANLHKGRVTGVAVNADGTQTLSAGRDGRVIATLISPDPLFRIQANALPSKFEELHSEEIANVKNVSFLSSGNGIVTTTNGHLAELTIPRKNTTSRDTRPLPKAATPATPTSNSDY